MAKPEPGGGDSDGEYTDYLLISSTDFTEGWKHNIMRLAPASSSEVVDPSKWSGGAKMNRRDQRRVRREEEQAARQAAQTAAEEAARARGEEIVKLEDQELMPGMPGYYAQKRAREAKEKAERDESLVAPGPGGAPASGSAPSRPRRGFGAPKKTRRVFITEESSKERRIRFEEQHPWYLETVEDEEDVKPSQQASASTSGSATPTAAGGGTTKWLGKMDSSASAVSVGGEGSSYMLLVLDQDARSNTTAFKVVPANRWYRFTPRPKYHTFTGDEAEEAYKEMQKSGDMDTWFASRRVKPATSTSSAAVQEGRATRGPDSFMSNGTAQAGGSNERGSSYAARFAQARGVSGSNPSNRFRTVVGDRAANDEDMWGEEQEAGPSGRRAGKARVRPQRREGLGEDQYEEMEFEAEFQDDEEGIGAVGDDAIEEEDTKELEERIKREMRAANHGLGDAVDDGEEEDEIAKNLTRAGQRVKRLLKRRGRKARPEEEEDDDEDDDDDDETRNPYASEEEEETDSEAEREREKERKEKADQAALTAEKNKQRTQELLLQQQQGRSGPNMPGSQQAAAAAAALSRNGSAGGHAKKPSSSTSSGMPSRAPSAPGSRATSPVPVSGNPKDSLLRRATSPVANGGTSRAASPTPPPSATKRKADSDRAASPSDGTSSSTSNKKRRKPGSPSPPASGPVTPGDDSALIAREQIITFIKEKTPTTKELLKYFKSALAKDARNKEIILKVMKEVATMNEGKLSVKPEFA